MGHEIRPDFDLPLCQTCGRPIYLDNSDHWQHDAPFENAEQAATIARLRKAGQELVNVLADDHPNVMPSERIVTAIHGLRAAMQAAEGGSDA